MSWAQTAALSKTTAVGLFKIVRGASFAAGTQPSTRADTKKKRKE